MPSRARPLGIALAADGWVRTIPAEVGETVRLGFRHSVYGSVVEEEFVVEEAGLRLTRLRYGEARLVEFYGHEHARREGGWWVVDGTRTLHRSVTLRVSPGSEMRLATQSATIDLTECVGPGSAVRLSVMADGA